MITTTVVSTKLDPFYQSFLRSFFDCNKTFFEFPRDHDLEQLISFTMRGAKLSSEKLDYGDENFNIEVSVQIYKENADCYVLPDTAIRLFIKRVKAFYWLMFHDEMIDLEGQGFEQQDAIDFFLLKYKLPDDVKTHERLKKHFYRFKKKKYYMRYQKKKKKNIKNSSALSSGAKA